VRSANRLSCTWYARGSMALINVAAREIHCKIVYYGPGMGGKTSNLQYIHTQVPKDAKGDLLSIATETERTLFFDFLPLDLGRVRGFQTRFHLYTVPGQVLYERTRVAVLNGADGVVFVADSQKQKLEENIKSLRELAVNITKQNKKFQEFPIILQYNKRDVPGALPVPTLDKYLNSLSWQRYEAVATTGAGIFDTLKAFARGGLFRFGVETMLRGPAIVVRAFAALLVVWTALLALPVSERFFPSATWQYGWVAFDVALGAALFALAHRWRRGLADVVAAAVTADAVLTIAQSIVYDLPRRRSVLDIFFLVVAITGPILASLLMWNARAHRT